MTIELFFTIASACIGCTYVLANRLGKIEQAMKSHVSTDEFQHKSLEGRIIKLEDRRNGRRPKS